MTTRIKAQTISPYLIGNNAWYDGSLANLWSKMSTAKFQAIRIGGAGAEGYGTTYSKYTTLIDGIRSANCEPIVQVPRWLSAQQAKDFITYINITMGKNIKYWIIGNEPNMTSNYSNEAAVATYIRTIASALKSIDPTILIIGPETAWYDAAYINLLTPGHADDITGKDAAGNYYLDIYSWHKYGFTSISGIETDVNSFLSKIATANALRPTGQKIGWAMTEVNTTYDNDQNTLGDDQFVWSFKAGQLYAELYGMGMRKGAFTMDFWSMLEGQIERRGTDLSLFDKDYTPRSNYYHSMMLGQNMKTNYITTTDNQTNITVIPMQDATGTAVMVLNNDRNNGFDYTLRLNSSNVTQSNTLNMYVNAGIASEIYGFIPSASTQMLVFDTQGTLIKRYIYTANDASARRAPTVQTTFCNNPPSVSIVPKQYKAIDKGQFVVNLYGINDADKWTQGITLTATSSNPAIVSVDAVNYTSGNTSGSLSLTPKTDGTATITLTVTENPHSCTPLTTTSTFVVRSYNPIPIPGKVEAENFIDMYGVQTQTTTDVGGGLNVGYIDKYDNMDYGVRVAKTGTYNVNYRLASASTSTTAPAFKLMNGVATNSTTLSSVTVAVTGGWQVWNTQSATFNLTAGDQILRLFITASGFNLNYIEFIDPNNTAVANVNAELGDIDISQSVDQMKFDLSAIANQSKISTFSIYSITGLTVLNQQLSSSTTKITVDKNQLPRGVYLAKCTTSNGSNVKKFMLTK